MHLARLTCLSLLGAIAFGCGASAPAAPSEASRSPTARSPDRDASRAEMVDAASRIDGEATGIDANAVIDPARSPDPAVPDGFAAVERAFAERRLGHLTEARALLDAAHLDVGPAVSSGDILRPRGGIAGIAFTARGTTGTAFFDATSGEPIGLVSSDAFNADQSEVPNAGSPGIFVGYSTGRGGALFDARNRAFLAIGPAVKVTKDGATAYVASEDQCTWSRWDLLTGRLVGDLERLTNTCSEPPYLATLTDDGKALIGGAWWDLDTRTIHRTPSGLAVFAGYSAAISPDQNYVAYLLAAAPGPGVPASFVTLVDRRTGAQRVSTEPLRTLSNGTPLSFGQSPDRVIVFDYGQWAFSIPSLQLLAKGGGPGPQDPALTPTYRSPPPSPPLPSEAETAPLRALLAQASCTRGGFIVPLDLCAGPDDADAN